MKGYLPILDFFNSISRIENLNNSEFSYLQNFRNHISGFNKKERIVSNEITFNLASVVLDKMRNKSKELQNAEDSFKSIKIQEKTLPKMRKELFRDVVVARLRMIRKFSHDIPNKEIVEARVQQCLEALEKYHYSPMQNVSLKNDVIKKYIETLELYYSNALSEIFSILTEIQNLNKKETDLLLDMWKGILIKPKEDFDFGYAYENRVKSGREAWRYKAEIKGLIGYNGRIKNLLDRIKSSRILLNETTLETSPTWTKTLNTAIKSAIS